VDLSGLTVLSLIDGHHGLDVGVHVEPRLMDSDVSPQSHNRGTARQSPSHKPAEARRLVARSLKMLCLQQIPAAVDHLSVSPWIDASVNDDCQDPRGV
jgi:hypothetical protein